MLPQANMGQRTLIILTCGLLLSACSTKHYRKSADKEAAKIIASKAPAVPNMDPNFTIDPAERFSLQGLPVFDRGEEAFGNESELERGARIISLEAALDLAVKYNRTYQTRKEGLYIDALSLSLVRRDYTPIFQTAGGVDYGVVEAGVNRITKTRSIGASQTSSVDQLLRIGTRLALDFTTDFTHFLTGGGNVSNSKIVGTLTQPLLRGGFRVAAEALTQAERTLLYSLREFTRYRKEFSVEIASDYYRVLQNRDAVRNSWRGLQNFKLNVEREKASAEVGQRSQAQLDQLRQAELQTESRWIDAVRNYRQSLDSFKIKLGLPTDSAVVLDEKELEDLQVVHPDINVVDALKIAVVSRLDLETARDVVIDAERHVKVRANAFLPGVDAIVTGTVGDSSARGFTAPDWRRQNWSAGFRFDVPWDQKARRNNYRIELINWERAKRRLELAVDEIKLEIADDWRNLDQARRNYQISEVGVELAARRVEEQHLRQETGSARARDLIDAQNDLIDSKNQLTSALVGHTIARLRFWRDMGILFIKENGQWEEGELEK